MARLLRVSLQGLHCSRLVSSPAPVYLRELQLLKPPEFKQISWRWYGESAVLEESCCSTQSASVTDGASTAANQGGDSAKQDDGVEKKGVSKEANDLSHPAGTAKESSSKPNSEKLSSLILGKMRGEPNSTSGQKDKGFQAEAEPHSAKTNTPQDESSKSVQEDKWQQVMSSIRKMAAKNRAKTTPGDKSGLPKREQGENQDDFADLDLPQAGGEAGISKSSNDPNRNSLATDAFGKAYNKQKDSRFQIWGNQQKAKEAKPHNFIDANGPITRAETATRDNSHSDRYLGSTRDSFSTMKPKDSHFQGGSQQRSKETKPVSFEFLRSPEANGAFPRAELQGRPPPNINEATRRGSSNDISIPRAELQDRSPPNVNEATRRGSSNDISVPYSGYTVCIQNLPGNTNLALVKDALSIHGEVIGSFKKPGLNESCAVYIEFKTAEAMDGALAARWLQLDSKAFTIARADLPITTVVRLSKVSGETTESQLLSICGRYGSLDTIRRRGNGVYDVFYKVRELPNISKILDSLNEVTVNRSRWVALPAPTLHPAVRKELLRSSEGKAWYASQVNQTLNRIEVGLDTVSVCFEDLKALTSMEVELSKR